MQNLMAHLPEIIRHLEEVKAKIEQELARLRRLQQAAGHPLPEVDTWAVAEQYTELQDVAGQ